MEVRAPLPSIQFSFWLLKLTKDGRCCSSESCKYKQFVAIVTTPVKRAALVLGVQKHFSWYSTNTNRTLIANPCFVILPAYCKKVHKKYQNKGWRSTCKSCICEILAQIGLRAQVVRGWKNFLYLTEFPLRYLVILGGFWIWNFI